MFDRIVQISTFEIRVGKLDAFKSSILKAVEFAREHGPQLLVAVSVDERTMHAYGCQIQPNAENIARHWKISDAYIAEVMRHCVLRRLDVYGMPNADIRHRLLQLCEQGIEVRLRPPFASFDKIHMNARS